MLWYLRGNLTLRSFSSLDYQSGAKETEDGARRPAGPSLDVNYGAITVEDGDFTVGLWILAISWDSGSKND